MKIFNQKQQSDSTIQQTALPWYRGVAGQSLLKKILVTGVLAIGAIIIFVPLIYMISISLKSKEQLKTDMLDPIPRSHVEVEVNGEPEPLYDVVIDGETVRMALIKNAPRGHGIFVDPAHPEVEYELFINDQIAIKELDIQWGNYKEALTIVPFDQYMMNTLIVTFVGMAGMLFSCSLVAYGFSRFRAPWINVFFLILLSTIMLPGQVRLIPMYIVFQKIGWVNTLLPLIIPQFFANAYDVFLLRQFFMTIPIEQDEAAKLDGASPFQILIHVILPQSKAALVTVGIFHFLYAWNDFYEPLIYLHSRDKWTMAVGLQTFNALYDVNTHLIMAASAVLIIPPVLLFFFSQRIFMQGVVITGSKG
jgi:multiple sugar transport system permease protein